MTAEAPTVLIVEDSPTMRSMYRAVLGDEELNLIFATDGLEGLDRAAQESAVRLYIVDINMPGLGGFEFLRRLRGELQIVDTPAIVVSTESEDSDRRNAFDAGATGYLTKPWTPEDLRAVVREALAGEGGERE